MLANRITTARVMLNVVMAILSEGDKNVRFLKDHFFDIQIIFFMTVHRPNIARLAQHANRTEWCFSVLHAWLLFHALKSESSSGLHLVACPAATSSALSALGWPSSAAGSLAPSATSGQTSH